MTTNPTTDEGELMSTKEARRKAVRAAKEMRAVLARVNTLLADADLEPVTLPPQPCMLNGCAKTSRVRSKFCSNEHRQQYPVPVWDSAGPDQKFKEIDEGLTSTKCYRTSPDDWQKPDHQLSKFLNEDGEVINGGTDLTEGEVVVRVLPSALSHENDRWPDFPVCSKCQPVIPRVHQDRISRRRTDGAVTVNDDFGLMRTLAFIPSRKPKVHTSARHSEGMTVRRTREGVRAAIQTASPEVVELAEASLKETLKQPRERFGGRRPVSINAYDTEWELEQPPTRGPDDEALEVGMSPFLERLTAKDRAALDLVYVQGFSMREASEELGLKEAGGGARVRRAVAKLKAALIEATEQEGGSVDEHPPTRRPTRLEDSALTKDDEAEGGE